MRVLVTGGAGYIGCVLVPALLDAGHEVVVVDAMWFGKNLPDHPKLVCVQRDMREGVPGENLRWAEAIIHLAAIANDPCGDLDARLTWDVNVLATLKLAEDAMAVGVKQFIFASSASIYGIKDNRPVHENEPFAPVSDYNKTKMVAEKLLRDTLRNSGTILQVARPATVCGYSPRQRLDVVVNMLTAQALENGVITAHAGEHGGALMRPHFHIMDMAALYLWMLRNPHCAGPYNAASENQSIGETAGIIAEHIGCKVEFSKTADKRSYAVSTDRLMDAGFKPEFTVRDAVVDLVTAWKERGTLRTEQSVNLEWMKSQGIARGNT